MINAIPEKQRALILQGGGALGAYEVGVLIELFNKLKEKDNDDDKPLFDVIAGTSIGAINAAVLVSQVTQIKKNNPNLTIKDCWKNAIDKLEQFWKHISTPTPIHAKFISNGWWWQENNKNIASKEAARKYYSTKQFFTTGVENVFSPPTILYDTKFFDNIQYSPPNNVWYRYNNTPLRESIESIIGKNFSIKTRPYFSDDNSAIEGPRLLVVSVDVDDATAVVFDSYGKLYNKKNNIYEWKTIYGHNNQHIIKYPDGVSIDHVMASATIPIIYDYQEISGRKFWDGAVLSNTPLRELIGKHKSFWQNQINKKKLEEGMWKTEKGSSDNDKIPDLEAYVISIWSSNEPYIPTDHDGVKDRYNDIRYSDRTKYDEKMALFVSDYIELIKQTRNIALNNFKTESEKSKFIKEVDEFLNVEAKSKTRSGKQRKYKELIKGRFELTKIIRIERRDNLDAIYSKFADFTSETIDELIEQGKKDTLEQIKE